MKKALIPMLAVLSLVTACGPKGAAKGAATGYAGTITQHAELQAYATLRAARNALDGMKVEDDKFWKTGFTEADDAGGKVSSEFKLSSDKRNFLALNGAVTAANAAQFADATAVDPAVKQLDKTKHPVKKVWYNLYNASDNFLSATYKPLLEKYAKLLNIELIYQGGDGTSEASIVDNWTPDSADAYCINMIRTNDDDTFTSKLTGDNAKKPVVWFNRQPSDPDTGKIRDNAIKFNDYSCYVGFDAAGGGATQGQMIVDYIKAHADTIDINGDGTIGYVLNIGDAAHNDSIARTRGIRAALGTGVEKDGVIDADAKTKKEGSITVGSKTFKVVELEAQEMKNGTSTWDAATAADVTKGWFNKRKTQIDMVVSNNDGMGMAAYNAWAKDAGVPTFGYDANTDAVAAIK